MTRLVLPAFALLLLMGCGDTTPAANAQAAQAKRSGPPTRADIEAVLTRRIRSLATGVGSSHKSVEIAFQTVQIAPGRAVNAQDKVDGIRGTTAWPVRVRYRENRHWGNGSSEVVNTYYAYDFYRDDFGDWNYLGHGPVQ